LIEFLANVLLSLGFDLIFKLTNFSLDGASCFYEIDELAEFGVETDEELVGLLGVFVFF
jgi:hypothetical protein